VRWGGGVGGFGKRNDRRHKINIRLNCAAVGTRIRGRSVTPRMKKTEGGRIWVTTSSRVSLEGGTHVVGYEARSHTLVPSVARPFCQPHRWRSRQGDWPPDFRCFESAVQSYINKIHCVINIFN
jgi:hypothetical protein